MFLSIVISIFVSLLIIILGHRLWNDFKDRFSVKKTDHFVRSQIDKYKTIIEELKNPPLSSIDPETVDLKQDLEDYLNEINV